MKYKIGDKVKYDGGDWWLYGTVNAMFEHSICPCYRLSVERMEKKNCKFSITQFEFELEAYDEADSNQDARKWEISEIEDLKKFYGALSSADLSKVLKRSPQAIEEKWLQLKPQSVQKPKTKPEQKPETKPEQKPEVKLEQKPEAKPEQKLEAKPEPIAFQTNATRLRKTSDAWDKNLDDYLKGKKSNVLNAWKAKNRKDLKIGMLSEDKYKKLVAVNFPFEVDTRKKQDKVDLPQNQKKEIKKRKRGEAWDENLEAYQRGEKSNLISTWIAYNRKQFKDGKLAEQKYAKLMDINFPFEVVKKKIDSWDKHLEQWKNGDRKSSLVQQWRQKSIRQFVDGILPEDKVLKLKEVGILK